MNHLTHRTGFSLVELSIVLIIIGLLVGSIISANHLIKAARVNSLVQDLTQYQRAWQFFRERYKAIPGDMPNATEHWGKHPSLCPGHSGSIQANGTCNGDGDQIVSHVAFPALSERWLFWNHLSLAGLVSGGPYEVDWSGGVKVGQHVPASPFPRASFAPFYSALGGNTSFFYANTEGTFLRHGVPNPAQPDSFNGFREFSPAQGVAVDKKIDDGRPAHGIVRAHHGKAGTTNLGCAAPNDPDAFENAVYTPSGGSTCILLFLLD